MEEHVGQWWHRLVTRAAQRHAVQHFPDAAVALADVRRAVQMMFHAGGGARAVRLAEAAERTVSTRTRRSLVERLAGAGKRAAQPSLDDDALALPPVVALFPDAADNRALYLWWAALAASARDDATQASTPWLDAQVAASRRALAQFPGLRAAHRRLVQAHLAQRPAAQGSAAEQAVRAALHASMQPDAVAPALADVAPDADDVAPVWLWLLPWAERPTLHGKLADAAETAPAPRPARKTAADRKRRHAERLQDERDDAPLVLPFRAESLLSFAEMVKVNRADDDAEQDDAARAAEDLDLIAVADRGESAASRVRFDLDLPSAAADDVPLGAAQRLPEWDWRARRMKPDHCAVQWFTPRLDADAPPPVPSPALRAAARRVRRRLDAMRHQPRRLRGLRDGDELDLDAWVRFATERASGVPQPDDPPVLERTLRDQRSLATLLLADLSLSTDATVGARDAARRVVDVVRDALVVFGEALDASGDAFEIAGFSSVRRDHVRLHALKRFAEPWGPLPKRRLDAIKPGFYTRLGAGLRDATRQLSKRPERTRLLLLLTDGKPHDVDGYEGRYALEDTAHAVREARDAGLEPFAITIDTEAADYLPMLFGTQGYARVAKPEQLVLRLTDVYARLTRG